MLAGEALSQGERVSPKATGEGLRRLPLGLIFDAATPHPAASQPPSPYGRRLRRRHRLMTHLGYVVAAYLATAIVLLGMVATVVLDLARQKRRLARLEAEGGRRRSEAAR